MGGLRRGFAALVMLVGVAACSDPGATSRPAASQTAPPSATPSAEATGPGAGDSAPASTTFAWEAGVARGSILHVARHPGGVVVMMHARTVGFDDSGRRLWTLPGPRPRGGASGGLNVGDVMIRYTGSDGRDRRLIHTIDPMSGRRLWSARVRDLVISQRTVFTVRCHGPGRPQSGCVTQARDPESGRIQWERAGSEHASLDLSAGILTVTGYPYGTDRSKDPYGERTSVVRYDARSGRRVSPGVLGAEFTVAGRVLIEHGYARSVGRDCQLDLTARGPGNAELWRRSFTWRLLEDDADCDLPVSVQPIDLGRVVVQTPQGFGQILKLRTGRTMWDFGGNRAVYGSAGGVDVVGVRNEVQGFDARTHQRLWRVSGRVALDALDFSDGLFGTEVRDPGPWYRLQEIRDVRTGEVVVEAPGSVVTVGDGWLGMAARRDFRQFAGIVDLPS